MVNKTDEQVKEEIIKESLDRHNNLNLSINDYEGLIDFIIQKSREGYISKEEHENMVLAIKSMHDEIVKNIIEQKSKEIEELKKELEDYVILMNVIKCPKCKGSCKERNPNIDLQSYGEKGNSFRNCSNCSSVDVSFGYLLDGKPFSMSAVEEERWEKIHKSNPELSNFKSEVIKKIDELSSCQKGYPHICHKHPEDCEKIVYVEDLKKSIGGK